MFKSFAGGVALAVLINCSLAHAHTPFRDAMAEHYGFAKKTEISCNTCHSKKSQVPEDQWDAALAEGKSTKIFRNGFGKHIEELLKGQDITAKIEAAKTKAKGLPIAQANQIKDPVNAKAAAAFLAVLKEFEMMKSPDGPTWKELIQAKKIDGIK